MTKRKSTLLIQPVPEGQLVHRGGFGKWKKGDIIPAAVWDAYMAGELVDVGNGYSYQLHTP